MNKTSAMRVGIVLWTLGIMTMAQNSGAREVVTPSRIQPSALLSIDQNRSTVVDRIVGEWGDRLEASRAGINRAQRREMLLAMPADQLLAASLAGSLDGLRNVLVHGLSAPVTTKPSLQVKALGDPGDDVVYTPVIPCRLVDTRNAFAAVYQGAGAFTGGEIRNYTIQGGNGVCLSQLPPGLNPSAVQLQVFGIPINGGSNGDVEILPQGSTFGSTATLVYLGNVLLTSASTTARINLANNQIGVQVRGGGADLAIDVVGYFKPPAGTVQPAAILWVAKSGGNYTSIQSAINAAAAVASATQPYLVKIAPGTYTEQVTLKDFVVVEGSGQYVTVIQYAAASPTVTVGAVSELRNLTVINTRNAAFPGANAIAQSTNTANGVSTLDSISAIADGATDNVALYVTGGFLNVHASDVEAAPSGTQTGTEVGLWATGATSDVVVRNAKLAASSGTIRQSAHKELGANVRIENTQLKGTTFGTPSCFNNYIGSDFTLAICP